MIFISEKTKTGILIAFYNIFVFKPATTYIIQFLQFVELIYLQLLPLHYDFITKKAKRSSYNQLDISATITFTLQL